MIDLVKGHQHVETCPRHPCDDCIYSRTITDGQITWPYFFCFRSHRLIVESGSTPTCVAESCTAQLSSQRTTEMPVCFSYFTSIAPLPSFLSSLSLLRLQLRRRFVRIVPADQIPHDFRRICNSQLVNQIKLSKYTLKFICYTETFHTISSQNLKTEKHNFQRHWGPTVVHQEIMRQPAYTTSCHDFEASFLIFLRYCRRLFFSFVRAHQRSFFLWVHLVDKCHAAW